MNTKIYEIQQEMIMMAFYHDYDAFKNIPFVKAREKLTYYLNMQNNEDYKKFQNYLVKNHLTPDDYEALKEVNYITIIVNVACTAASIWFSCMIIRAISPDEQETAATVDAENAGKLYNLNMQLQLLDMLTTWLSHKLHKERELVKPYKICIEIIC